MKRFKTKIIKIHGKTAEPNLKEINELGLNGWRLEEVRRYCKENTHVYIYRKLNNKFNRNKMNNMKKLLEKLSKLIKDYEDELIHIAQNREDDNKVGDHSFFIGYDMAKINVDEFIGELKKLQIVAKKIDFNKNRIT